MKSKPLPAFPSLAGRLRSCEIDTAPRMRDKPSDHTPILVEVD